MEPELHGTCARPRRRKRAQVGAAALDLVEDANALVIECDIIRLETEELWKVDTDMPNVLCIVAANSVKKQGYELRVALSEVETIMSVKQRGSFAVDGLVRAKKRWRERSRVEPSLKSPKMSVILIH